MPFGREIVGVGIDLVSWDRIERFLAEHSAGSLHRLLAPSEQKAFQDAPQPAAFFARCFAAKEAYFKARGDSWMGGENGFGQIEIVMNGKYEFGIASDFQAEGKFFESPNGIGARVFLWRERNF